MTFRAPVRDLAFALSTVGHDALIARAYPDLDADTVAAVLEAAGAFTTDVLPPLNRIGDIEGARYANGVVTAAPCFAYPYRAFVAHAWNSLSAPPEYGAHRPPP